jgi:hypothetical protein
MDNTGQISRSSQHYPHIFVLFKFADKARLRGHLGIKFLFASLAAVFTQGPVNHWFALEVSIILIFFLPHE